jgi:hypothetical protein
VNEKSKPRNYFKSLNIHSILALAGIVGPVMLVAGDLAAGLSSPNYSLVRDSISSLALTRIGWLQTIGFLALGLLVEIFVAGLLFNIRGARGFRLSIGLLVFSGFGLLLIGAFRTDPVGMPHTVEGTIHSVTATTVFWLFPLAILLLTLSLRKDPYWKTIFAYSVAAGVFALALMIGRLWPLAHISWFGLYERILVANIIVWVAVTAVQLLRLSLKRERSVVKADRILE